MNLLEFPSDDFVKELWIEKPSILSEQKVQQVLAEGISMAMYTTAFGLIVAVPILFAHQLISGRMERVLIQIEEGASDLLGALAGRHALGKPSNPSQSESKDLV